MVNIYSYKEQQHSGLPHVYPHDKNTDRLSSSSAPGSLCVGFTITRQVFFSLLRYQHASRHQNVFWWRQIQPCILVPKLSIRLWLDFPVRRGAWGETLETNVRGKKKKSTYYDLLLIKLTIIFQNLGSITGQSEYLYKNQGKPSSWNLLSFYFRRFLHKTRRYSEFGLTVLDITVNKLQLTVDKFFLVI